MRQLETERTSTYAYGVLLGHTMVFAGFTPTELVFGVRWSSDQFSLHFGLFALGVIKCN